MEHRGLGPDGFAERFEQRVESHEKPGEDEMTSYMTPMPNIDRVAREVRHKLRRVISGTSRCSGSGVVDHFGSSRIVR